MMLLSFQEDKSSSDRSFREESEPVFDSSEVFLPPPEPFSMDTDRSQPTLKLPAIGTAGSVGAASNVDASSDNQSVGGSTSSTVHSSEDREAISSKQYSETNGLERRNVDVSPSKSIIDPWQRKPSVELTNRLAHPLPSSGSGSPPSVAEPPKLINRDLPSNASGGASGGANIGGVSIASLRTARPNLNIRAPQGIPGGALRKPFINPMVAASTAPASDDAEMDTNPLRRLRDSQQTYIGRPMTTFRPPPVAIAGSENDQAVASRNLNANLSFFDKLKEQEQQKLS